MPKSDDSGSGLTLSLFRHAKSSWDAPASGDFDRPLSPRGQKAAPRMARFMSAKRVEPNLILCSTAIRARQTLDLALPYLGGDPEIRFDDALYHASLKQLMEFVRATPNEVRHLMIIGHNPGLHALALRVAIPGSSGDRADLATKFPTAALAVFHLTATKWQDVGTRTGKLALYMVPRQLKKAP